MNKCYLLRVGATDSTFQKKDPPWLSQRVGRDSKYQKYSESSFSWLSNWSLPHALYAQTRVQWLAMPLFQPDPLQLASRGWSSPAILPTWDRTENLTVNSPTPTPTKPRWLWLFHVRMCLYIPGYPRTSREFKNLKFKFCIDQESNWRSSGCLCHHMTYTTRPKIHI